MTQESLTPEAICEALLNSPSPAEQETLLAAASHDPGCLQLLLTQAQQALPAEPFVALVVADLAAEVSRRLADRRSEAVSWRLRAQSLRVSGRHAEALLAFQEAVKCAREAPDPLLEAQVQIGRVDSLQWTGCYEEAILLGHDLVERLRVLGAEEDSARVLVNLGSVHFRRDRYMEALICYDEAAEVLGRCGDPVASARVQTNSANILSQLGRADEAQALYQKARAVFAQRAMASIVAMIDANVGFLHFLCGEYTDALNALLRARQEFDTRDQSLDRAKCDADLADVYGRLNLLPEALQRYDQAIGTFALIPLDYERGKAELGRSGVLLALGRQEEAETALDRADQVFAAHRNPVQRAHVLLMRAQLHRSRGENTAAVAAAQSAARHFARCRLPSWAAEASLLLAEMKLETEVVSDVSLRRSLAKVARVARAHARGWVECRAERALGQYYTQTGQINLALRHLRAAVEALEAARTLVAPEELHVAFLRDKLGVYEQLVALLLQRSRAEDVAEAFQCVERARSRLLLERVQAVLERRTDPGDNEENEGDSLRARLAALRRELSRSYHHLQTDGQGESRLLTTAGTINRETLVPLEKAYRDLLREADLAQHPSGTLPSSALMPIDALCAALLPNEALIEYTRVQDRVCAFILTPSGLHVHRDLAPCHEITHLAHRLRYHIQKAGIESAYVKRHLQEMVECTQHVLAQCYDLLLRPLLELLPFPQITRIVVAPHGSLHRLPFHAFYDGERYTLDRWEMIYTPSAAVWNAGVTHAAANSLLTQPLTRQNALIMGVPTSGIEHVATEVEDLAQILPLSEKYCGDEATLETFRSRAGHFRVIHLATHALFRADNPLFSGLRFADGWLLARDLYEMRLDCDLATLSACRTGISDVDAGDELFGLTRGFLAAGARSLAVSLWPADDQATAALMVRFYTLMAAGQTRAAALSAAQQATRMDFPHPYHWAAFALIGER